VAAPVRLQFDTQEVPQEGHTANLSTGGMFVPGKNPRPVGTLLRFELMLDEGEPIKGVGEIVWIRPRSQGPEAPSGMGVQFGHVEESNRDRLRVAVFEALEALGIDSLAEAVPDPAVERTHLPKRRATTTGTDKAKERPPVRKPRLRDKSRLTKKTKGSASRTPKKSKKTAQPSPLAVSGRTKMLIVLLALLALLLLLLT